MKMKVATLLIMFLMLGARGNPRGPLNPPEMTQPKVYLVTLWEDGSYKLSDGSTGCLPWGICD